MATKKVPKPFFIENFHFFIKKLWSQKNLEKIKRRASPSKTTFLKKNVGGFIAAFQKWTF